MRKPYKITDSSGRIWTAKRLAAYAKRGESWGVRAIRKIKKGLATIDEYVESVKKNKPLSAFLCEEYELGFEEMSEEQRETILDFSRVHYGVKSANELVAAERR